MPFLINRVNNKYELRLKDNNELLGTHTSKEKAKKQIMAIEINKNQSGKKPYKTIKGYTYFISDKPDKKLMVDVNGKRLYFGATGYQHYKDKTGLLNPDLNHLDKTRRKRYLIRASNIKDKEGNYTHLNPESPNYHAINILW